MKKVLSYVAIFLLGAFVTYGVFSFSGEFGLGKTARNLPVEEVKEVGSVLKDPLVCLVDNCDLYEKLELLHDELGQSSWTLKSMVTVLADKSDFLRDELGHSSWTLSAVVNELADKIDISRTFLWEQLETIMVTQAGLIRNDIQDYCL